MHYTNEMCFKLKVPVFFSDVFVGKQIHPHLHGSVLQLFRQQPHHTHALYSKEAQEEYATCHSRLMYLSPPAVWTSHSNKKASVFSEHASTGGWRRQGRVTAAAPTVEISKESRRGQAQSDQACVLWTHSKYTEV